MFADLLEVFQEGEGAMHSAVALSIFIEGSRLYTKMKGEKASAGFDPGLAGVQTRPQKWETLVGKLAFK